MDKLREANYRSGDTPSKKLGIHVPHLSGKTLFWTALAPEHVETALVKFLQERQFNYDVNGDEFTVDFTFGRQPNSEEVKDEQVSEGELEALLLQSMDDLG